MAINLTMSPQMNDESLVELSDEQKAELKKKVRETVHALSFLLELVDRDDLRVSNRFSIFGVAEARLGEAGTLVGYDSDIEKEHERRSRDIRAANQEIRRLEELVGSERGLDGIAEKLSLLRKNVEDYWKSLGFCLAYADPYNHERPGGWGAGHGRISFYVSLSTHFNTYDDNAPNLAENMDLFEADGDRGHPQVLDTPRNREYIQNRLREKYPSMEVLSWNIVQCYGRGNTDMQIRDLFIRIGNINDME